MELKDFISESLNQICCGIREARNKNIVTVIADPSSSDPQARSTQHNTSPIAPEYCHRVSTPDEAGEKVHFDISVTITDDEKLIATGGLDLKLVKGGMDKQNSTKIENTHRINFSIPILPHLLKK